MSTIEEGRSSGPVPLYYQVHRTGPNTRPPLLLIHGGGSTIESNWGLLLPEVARSRTVIAVELQAHGRTPASPRPPSFDSSADDVATLIRDDLELGPVDVLGFSNGGQVAMRLAAHTPSVVRRLVVASAPFRRDGRRPGSGTGWRRRHS